jgi:hypothetical protein
LTVKKRKTERMDLPPLSADNAALRRTIAVLRCLLLVVSVAIIALAVRRVFTAPVYEQPVISSRVDDSVKPNPRPLPEREGDLEIKSDAPAAVIVKSKSVPKKRHAHLRGARFVCAGGHPVGLDRCTQ